MQAVIFDFDGVVVDSETHWDPCMEELCAELCAGWMPGGNARLLTGLNAHDTWLCLRSEYGLTLSEEEFMRRIGLITDVIYGSKAGLNPGVERLIAQLRDEALPVGLATSSQRAWIDAGLKRLGLHASFDAFATGDEVGPGRGKPAPDLYLLAAQRLQVDPRRAVAIEDSRNGVAAAKAAGMVCVGLRNGTNDGQDLSAADIIVEGFGTVDPAFLRSLVA
jgi:HAD superfamily hydrolase (TIGR01509 family)